jgi:hypothetical protein
MPLLAGGSDRFFPCRFQQELIRKAYPEREAAAAKPKSDAPKVSLSAQLLTSWSVCSRPVLCSVRRRRANPCPLSAAPNASSLRPAALLALVVVVVPCLVRARRD